MILIDFAPGAHGHFLEFIVNRYIFGVEHSVESIFQSTGATHVIDVDPIYQKNKVAKCQHYSSLDNNKRYKTQFDKIIFIKHDPNFDFVLLTNIFYRCHPDVVRSKDANADLIIAFHTQMMGNLTTDRDLRNDWFAKLNERHFDECEKRAQSDVSVFDFDFGSFFNLTKFLQELERMAEYLNITFKFDLSLVELWNEFMDKNQGYKLYNLANTLLNHVYNNHNVEIPNNWKLHAYMNNTISKIFRIHDGELFEAEQYPTNTQQFHKIILDHTSSFDARFP